MNLPEDFYTVPSPQPDLDLLQLMIEWEWVKQEQRRRWAELIDNAKGETDK